MTLKAISIAPNNYQNLVELDRVLVDTMGQKTSGVIFEDVTLPELKCSAGSGHTIDIAIGKAVIREKVNPTVRGSYFFQNDAILNIAMPIPQSQPFIATVIAVVTDPQYGAVTGAVGPRIDVVSGTPASAPTAVSDASLDAIAGTPGGWTRLYDIRVNTADTGVIPAGQFTDARKPGGFGVIKCIAANRPTTAADGLQIYRMDTRVSETYDAVAALWFGGAWIAYTPTWRNGVGGATLLIFSGTLAGWYHKQGKTVHFRVRLVRAADSQIGTVAPYSFTLPIASLSSSTRPTGTAYVWNVSASGPVGGYWIAWNATEITCHTTSANLAIGNAGFGEAWAVNDEINISGTYEVA